MSPSRKRPTVMDSAPIPGAYGAGIGAFMAWVFAFDGDYPVVPAMLAGALICAALGALGGYALDAGARRKWDDEANNEREWMRRARDEKKTAERQKHLQLERNVQALPAAAVRHYQQSLVELELAQRWLEQAQVHRTAGAFTPFWESVEQGFAALNRHRNCLMNVSRNAEAYGPALAQLAETNPQAVSTVDGFPPGVVDGLAHEAGRKVADQFETVVYKAQLNYQFASIFEQRRTTAAVFVGFSSLSDAVARMGSAITTSVSEVTASIGAMSREVAGIGERMDRPVPLMPDQSLAGQVVEINQHLSQIARRH